MRNLSLMFSGFALTFALCFNPSPAEIGEKSDAPTAAVAMKSMSFDPKKLEVHVGDSVVWTNKAFTTHTATSDDDGKTFNTGDVSRGESSKPVKFEMEGEFKYYCKVHGKSMSGTVVVKAVEK